MTELLIKLIPYLVASAVGILVLGCLLFRLTSLFRIPPSESSQSHDGLSVTDPRKSARKVSKQEFLVRASPEYVTVLRAARALQSMQEVLVGEAVDIDYRASPDAPKSRIELKQMFNTHGVYIVFNTRETRAVVHSIRGSGSTW